MTRVYIVCVLNFSLFAYFIEKSNFEIIRIKSNMQVNICCEIKLFSWKKVKIESKIVANLLTVTSQG